MEINEDEELKRAIKQSLLDSARAQPEKKEEKKEKVEELEPKKEEKKPETRKEKIKIEKSNKFNFSEEKPNAPLIKKKRKKSRRKTKA